MSKDEIYGRRSPDRVFGGPSADYINVADDRNDDRVDCGGGVDTVVMDAGDDSDSDCNTVLVPQ
jgi:hypothetical protein